MTSRSFSKPVTTLEELKEAISYYATRACEKLRSQQSFAQAIYVFVKTNKFKKSIQQYRNGATYEFNTPTNNTLEVISKATKCMESIYKKGIEYKKAGILLMDLTSANQIQHSLFDDCTKVRSKSVQLMDAMDYLNNRFGRETIYSLASGIKKDWIINCNNRSPRYTTQWDELPGVG